MGMSILDTMVLLFTAVGIVWLIFGDDGVMSVEEYIRTHPEEFKR
jgi:hypothetical protein